MSLKDKIPGIYMIRNQMNNKVYIGSTNNLQKRFKQYMWATASDSSYTETTRTIVSEIKQFGWNNFEFIILEAGQSCFDEAERGYKEIEYIMKYRAIDPDYGYNLTMGGESGAFNPKIKEKLKPTTFMILYDIKHERAMLYLQGYKQIAKELKLEAAGVLTAAKRGTIMKNRYIAFYADSEKAKLIKDYVKEYRTGFSGWGNSGNSNKSKELYITYKAAYDDVKDFLKSLDL